MSLDFEVDKLAVPLDYEVDKSATKPTSQLDYEVDANAQVLRHLDVAKEAEGRTAGLNSILGVPHDDVSAKVDARSAAQVVVPLGPLQNQFANVVEQARSNEANVDKKNYVTLQTPLNDLLVNFPSKDSPRKGPSKFLEASKPDPLIGLIEGPEEYAKRKADFARERDKPQNLPQTLGWETEVAEGMSKASVVAPVRAAEMLARGSEATLSFMTAKPLLERLLAKASPETQAKAADVLGFGTDHAVDLLNRVGNYLDTKSTEPMSPQERESFSAKMFGSLGALPMMVAGAGMLGPYGTAAYLALQHGQGVSQTTEELALRDGNDPATARHMGNMMGTVTLPFSYTINLYNPLSRINEQGAAGTNLSTRVLYGGLQNYVVGKGEQIVRGGFAPLLSDPLHRDAVAKQMYGYAIDGANKDDAVALLTGGLIGGMTPPERLPLEESLRRLRVAPDVLNKQELIRQVKSQYEQPGGMSDDSPLLQSVELLDSMIQHKVRTEGGRPEDWYSSVVGSLKQSGELGGKASLILSDRGQRLYDAMASDDPHKAFAEVALLGRDAFMSPEDRGVIEKLFKVKAPDAKVAEAVAQRQDLLDLRNKVDDPAKASMLNAIVGMFDEQAPEAKPGSRWTDKQNENYVAGFERWLREGEAPTPELQRAFKDAASLLKSSGNNAQRVGLLARSSDFTSALDRLFVQDSDAVGAARQTVQQHELNVQIAQDDLKNASKFRSDPEAIKEFTKDSVVQQPVYHGTNVDAEFDLPKEGSHFGTIDQAEDLIAHDKKGEKSRVLPFYLKIKNALRIYDFGDSGHATAILDALQKEKGFSDTDRAALEQSARNEVPPSKVEGNTDQEKGKIYAERNNKIHELLEKKAIELAKLSGYDGLIYANRGEAPKDPADSYVPFSQSQVKSVFDPSFAKQGDSLAIREKNLLEARQAHEESKASLRDAQQQNFDPREPTRAEQMAVQGPTLIDNLVGDAKQGLAKRAVKGATRTFMGLFGNASDLLGNSPVATALKGWMHNASIYKMQLAGEMSDSIWAALNLMNKRDAQGIGAIDENGFSKARKLIEPSETYGQAQPSNQTEKAFVEVWKQIWNWSTGGMTENDFYRRVQSGDVLKALPSENMKMFRVGTQLAHDFASGRGGELLQRYMELVRKANPGVEITSDDLISEMQKPKFHVGTAKQGALEGARGDLILPDGFFDRFGRQQNVFHTFPENLLHATVDRLATRTAMVRYMGQDLLPNVADPESRAYYNRWKSLNDIFGATDKYGKDQLIENLYKLGESKSEMIGKSFKEVQALAQAHDLPIEAPIEDLLNNAKSFDARALNKDQVEQLRTMAQEVGGVNVQGTDPQWVLKQLKDRLTNQVEDNLMSHWRRKWANETGETEKFDRYINNWNGLFGNDVATFSGLKGAAMQALDITSSVVGGLATSLAPLKHLFQVARMAPLASEGWADIPSKVKDLTLAYAKELFDPSGSRADLRPFRSVADWGWNQRSRTGHMLVDLARDFRSSMARGTLMAPLMQMNEGVSAQLGRGLADEWINRKFGRESIGLAKSLGLNEGEVGMLIDRGVKVGDQIVPLDPANWQALYEKVVRGFQAKSLGADWELPQNRSIVESNPWARRMLGWQKWSSTALRSVEGIMTDVKTDPIKALPRVLGFIGAAMGVGVLQHVLVNAFKAVPEEAEDDDDKIKGAMLESALFGMPMNVMGGMKFSQGNADKFVLGFTPQIAALTKLVQVGFGWGRFGKASAPERIARGIEDITPLIKAIHTHIEQETYPQVGEYRSSRALYRKWLEKQPGGAPSASFDEAIDLDKWNVFKDVQRGDAESAQVALQDYMKGKFKQDPQILARLSASHKEGLGALFLDELRASLEDRRPVPLSGTNYAAFMSTLSVDQRIKINAQQNRYMAIVQRLVPKKPQMTLTP